MYLGLDISTSICGWSILDKSGSLEKWGYVKLPKKKPKDEKGPSLFEKMDYFRNDVEHILREYKDRIEVWGVEEAVKKFQSGLSTANTIYVCASFNFGVAYLVYEILGKEPIYIPVSTARKTVGLKIPRGLDKIARKSYIVEWCKLKYPSIKFGLTRNGTYKPWTFDVADSLVITEATQLKHERDFRREASNT